MAKKLGRLAGLAALAGAAYMVGNKFGKDKDATGPAATADEIKLSKDRTDAQKKAVSGLKPVEKSSSAYNPVASSDTRGQAALNRGVGDATNGAESPKSAPVKENRQNVKPIDLPEAGGGLSQSKGVLRSDRDMTQAEAKTILNQTPADKAKQAAKDRKDIDSNKADFRAYQRNLDAAKVANLKSNAATKQKVLDTLNQRAGANTPSALRSDQLANVSRATKREQKTKQFAQDVPYQESAAKTDAMMAASRAARKADALKKAAKKSSFKSGGMVSKVSSASRRADGIASRGKTKCKMY
jgi:hypothetical protein